MIATVGFVVVILAGLVGLLWGLPYLLERRRRRKVKQMFSEGARGYKPKR